MKLHKEFTEAGEATRAIYDQVEDTVERVTRVSEMTADFGMEWPISGDQLAALKADAKNREEVK